MHNAEQIRNQISRRARYREDLKEIRKQFPEFWALREDFSPYPRVARTIISGDSGLGPELQNAIIEILERKIKGITSSLNNIGIE